MGEFGSASLVRGFVPSGDEDQRQLGTGAPNNPAELESVADGQTYIGDQAIQPIGSIPFDQRLGRLKQQNRVAGRLEQILDGFENPCVIIHDRDRLPYVDDRAHSPGRADGILDVEFPRYADEFRE